jgi:hypothetical protein
MGDYFSKKIQESMALTGPRKWECIGKSIYRKEDSYVWKEGRKWYRTNLPVASFRIALVSVGIGPLGIFSESSGPYNTLAEAKKGKKRRRR